MEPHPDASSLVQHEQTVKHSLDTIAHLTKKALAADGVGISMLGDGDTFTTAWTDDFVCTVDEAQYDGDEGPCLQAMREGRTISVPSMPDEDRWPRFLKAAKEAGVMSSLSLPLEAEGEILGALNIYASRADAFGSSDPAQHEALAATGASALRNARLYVEARRTADQLGEAMASRATIEQAKGILMATRDLGPDEAFEALVKMSQDRNIKLREIAAELVREVTAQKDG